MKRNKYELTDLDGSLSVEFNNSNRAFVVSLMNIGSIDSKISSYSGAGQYGATITSRSFDTRDVEIQGHILADNAEDMRERKINLQRIVNPAQDFYLIIDGTYRLRLAATSTIQYEKEFYKHNDYLTSFTIDAVASNPFFELLEPIEANLAGWVKDLHFPLTNPQGQRFTVGHRAESKIVDVYSESEVPTGMIIKLKAIGGTVVNPTITNITTKEKFKVNAALQANEELLITTSYGRKSITNLTTKENWLNKLDLDSSWLQMEVGKSSFKCEGEHSSTGTIECNISYNPLLIEVL